MRLMMQSLLAERFKLAVHWETREAPVFALVPATAGKLGPQLRQHPASDDCATTAFSDEAKQGNSAGAAGMHCLQRLPIACGMIAHLPPSDRRRIALAGAMCRWRCWRSRWRRRRGWWWCRGQ